MSASHHRWFRHLIAGAVIAASTAGAGCASQRATQPQIPDQSVLDPATQALDKAVSAHADQFAPRIVDSARRRITVARDILFKAAESDRSLTQDQNDRIQTLVDQARLDARAALIKTQAGAVQHQIEQLQGGDNASGAHHGGGAAAGQGNARGAGLGGSSLGSGMGLGNHTLGGAE